MVVQLCVIPIGNICAQFPSNIDVAYEVKKSVSFLFFDISCSIYMY